MHITLHPGLIVLAMAGSFIFGLMIRMVQVNILRKQVLELEKEKMDDHAEILQLQKQLADLQNKPSNPSVSTPVVPIMDKDSGQPDAGKNYWASH
ncbi:hypothetical protein [Flavihumibacter sp. ZG627]|uniref:hypothetical protein n=1 Tax=Flavihumibacter sp. ZG627 TaxID=1463156 RepID=UPI000A6F7EEB|nr:hypothetical protein [Flavihumibacter sp. ZG627]